MLVKTIFLTALSVLFCALSWSDEDILSGHENALAILERLQEIEAIEPSYWGIRNGCISVNKIRSIQFRNDQLAIIDMRGRKQVLLRLKRECKGIAEQGFSYQVRGGQLCERFNRLTQAQTGLQCEIASIQPYVRLVEDQT